MCWPNWPWKPARRPLNPEQNGLAFSRRQGAAARKWVSQACRELECDWAYVPAGLTSHFGLWMTDMDSNDPDPRCIDEIAGMLGLKDKVAAITERSMAGELILRNHCVSRRPCLAGLKETTLKVVYEKSQTQPRRQRTGCRLPGRGVKIGLISGGFTYFTNRLKQELGLDYAIANTLEVVRPADWHGQGDIIDAQAKADWLLKLRGELGLRPDQVFATGDGANDLKMLAAAGVGVPPRQAGGASSGACGAQPQRPGRRDQPLCRLTHSPCRCRRWNTLSFDAELVCRQRAASRSAPRNSTTPAWRCACWAPPSKPAKTRCCCASKPSWTSAWPGWAKMHDNNTATAGCADWGWSNLPGAAEADEPAAAQQR